MLSARAQGRGTGLRPIIMSTTWRKGPTRGNRATKAKRVKENIRNAILNTVQIFPKRRGDPEPSSTSEGCERREPYKAAGGTRRWFGHWFLVIRAGRSDATKGESCL